MTPDPAIVLLAKQSRPGLEAWGDKWKCGSRCRQSEHRSASERAIHGVPRKVNGNIGAVTTVLSAIRAARLEWIARAIQAARAAIMLCTEYFFGKLSRFARSAEVEFLDITDAVGVTLGRMRLQSVHGLGECVMGCLQLSVDSREYNKNSLNRTSVFLMPPACEATA
jgi:hypothetical protein